MRVLTELKTVQLKSQEEFTVIRVAAPAPEWEERLVGVVGHKGEPWVGALRLVLAEELPGLEVYVYLGLLEGETIGNIMSTEATAPRVGILGNVFTAPAHRRKGVCAALMAAFTEDFLKRGGRAMTLGTGHDSPAYHIYDRFGFRGVGQTGRMIWEAQPGFLTDYFGAGPTTVRGIAWPDWALLDLLYSIEESDYLRNVCFAQYGPNGYEGLFPQLHDLAERAPARSHVLMKDGGQVVAHASLLPDPRWPGSVLLLDVFTHPDFRQSAAELLAALAFPPHAKIQAHAEATSAGKIALLKGRGLREEAILRNQLLRADQRLDVIVLSNMA